MKAPAADRRERSFGITFGVLGLALAAWLSWKPHAAAPLAGVTGTVLLAAALMRPRVLKIPSDLWARLSAVLGWVNSRVILLALFFLVLTPVGLVRRVFGADPLRLRRGGAGWSPYPSRYRDRKHYERLF